MWSFVMQSHHTLLEATLKGVAEVNLWNGQGKDAGKKNEGKNGARHLDVLDSKFCVSCVGTLFKEGYLVEEGIAVCTDDLLFDGQRSRALWALNGDDGIDRQFKVRLRGRRHVSD